MHYLKFHEDWILKSKKNRSIFTFFHNFFRGSEDKNQGKEVKFWYLEVDQEGKICREIALDEDGNVLEIAPYKNNRGQWADSNITINPNEYEKIDLLDFNKKWHQGEH